MKLLFFCILIPYVMGQDDSNNLSLECLEQIISPYNTWTANSETNEYVIDRVLHEIYASLKKHLPDVVQPKWQVLSDHLPHYFPDSFDARSEWPLCRSIRQIRQQGSCGSCWAVSAASTISDRICIQSYGNIQDTVSSTEMISCSETDGGCDGGYTWNAYMYWYKYGLVTGGEYGSHEGCKNYPFKLHENITTPPCSNTCDEDSYYPFDHKFYGRHPYMVVPNHHGETPEERIMKEIYYYGPVTASFTLYLDFYKYDKGIYRHICGPQKGHHGVKIIGWGTEDNTKYWLVSNSWGDHWGENGLFRIVRGENECDIESYVIAGLSEHV